MSGVESPVVGPGGADEAAQPFPAWLEPVRTATERMAAADLTRYVPPADGSARPGAVLMLFGERAGADVDPADPLAWREAGELLLTERAHDMRSHPGQVSFPGGSLDPGEGVEEAALREAQEEVGLDPGCVQVFGRLPELWLPPSNFAVTPVLGWWAVPSRVRIASEGEVHAIHRAPLAELVDPEHRRTVVHPSGYRGPGFLIGDDHDVVLWGFTGGIVARLLDFLGWAEPWDTSREAGLPDYMLAADEATRRRSRLLDIEDDL
ncbi:NUDIX hydrolase [Nocardioides bruguierae]|uniref:NUDIX hydrolase n=1 Tax=Nocardioides bruguierae TaxID=2945102 RepID=UPI002021D565|nr:CoA pyrophosphatase [Nocardioides bruguierae]MCL8027437.1 CoA pyrophosphatase [Nocardioides bruguierae]